MTVSKNDADQPKHDLKIDSLSADLNTLLGKLSDLQTLSADSAETLRNQLCESNSQLDSLKQERNSLLSLANERRNKEKFNVTQLYRDRFDRDMESLLRENITIPDYKMRLYWDHLRLRLEPALNTGVAILLSFPHSTRLSDLRFVLQFAPSDETFIVTDCDPMVIGLADLVATLNADTRPGALARFCCRVRSTYTAQYSTDI